MYSESIRRIIAHAHVTLDFDVDPEFHRGFEEGYAENLAGKPHVEKNPYGNYYAGHLWGWTFAKKGRERNSLEAWLARQDD